MEDTVDLRLVIKHLANGTLGEHLCIICLKQLTNEYENIHTMVCKEEHEFCIADILKDLTQIQFLDNDNYNVCVGCFKLAFSAYKFYLLSKKNTEILNFYSDELITNLDMVNLPEELTQNTLCISLSEIKINNSIYDYSLNGIGKKDIKKETEVSKEKVKAEKVDDKENLDSDIVVVMEDGKPLFYKLHQDGIKLILLTEQEQKMCKDRFYKSMLPNDGPKKRKKRLPMAYTVCSYCPVKYRFVAKLKEHMKLQHNADLFICKVCKAITENEQDYHNHLNTHTNIHQCALCNTVFKRRETIISHLKWHEKMKNISKTEGAHICEVCGVILESEESLREHYDNKHNKKYTCYYCGRMYKGEHSFEMHIKKHEALKNNDKYTDANSKSTITAKEKSKAEEKKKHMCVTCGKYFVDDRALMWHQRLHNNERPYPCEVCGKGFVSLNRRNQHALCAHTAPTRRCPLCPSLFHLKSMVNTHIKKVHLKAHKRRNRVSKHQNVYWRTEPVPIQELSFDIQNDILELQQAAKMDKDMLDIAMEDLERIFPTAHKTS